MRYFTSDLHFGSTNILTYASRPFSTAKEARGTLIANINETCDRSDILFHVGDFMLQGTDRHGEVEDCGLGDTQDVLLQKIKCPVILLSGNHDDAHNCVTHIKKMTIDLGCYRNISVSHFPLTYENYRYVGNENHKSCSDKIHIHLCGHVHDKWMLFFDAKAHVLNYNVGVDCHNYKPVKASQIKEDLDFIFTYHDFNQSWKMTVQNMIEWKIKIKVKLNNDREKRKQERYRKKGLTEAECLRRKEEALRKKGILK